MQQSTITGAVVSSPSPNKNSKPRTPLDREQLGGALTSNQNHDVAVGSSSCSKSKSISSAQAANSNSSSSSSSSSTTLLVYAKVRNASRPYFNVAIQGVSWLAKHSWTIFDTFIVVCSFLDLLVLFFYGKDEIGTIVIFRLLRVMRVFRTVKLLRYLYIITHF